MEVEMLEAVGLARAGVIHRTHLISIQPLNWREMDKQDAEVDDPECQLYGSKMSNIAQSPPPPVFSEGSPQRKSCDENVLATLCFLCN